MSDNKSLSLLSMANQMKVSEMSEQIVDRIKSGEINPAAIGVVLKKFHKLYESVNEDKEAKEAIFKETEKYKEGNKKTINLLGASITIGSVRTWWEYHECGDPLWDSLDSLEKQIKAIKKQREEQLQATVPKADMLIGMPATTMVIESLPKLVWEENGEVVNITPPVKKSMDGLKYRV